MRNREYYLRQANHYQDRCARLHASMVTAQHKCLYDSPFNFAYHRKQCVGLQRQIEQTHQVMADYMRLLAIGDALLTCVGNSAQNRYALAWLAIGDIILDKGSLDKVD